MTHHEVPSGMKICSTAVLSRQAILQPRSLGLGVDFRSGAKAPQHQTLLFLAYAHDSSKSCWTEGLLIRLRGFLPLRLFVVVTY